MESVFSATFCAEVTENALLRVETATLALCFARDPHVDRDHRCRLLVAPDGTLFYGADTSAVECKSRTWWREVGMLSGQWAERGDTLHQLASVLGAIRLELLLQAAEDFRHLRSQVHSRFGHATQHVTALS